MQAIAMKADGMNGAEERAQAPVVHLRVIPSPLYPAHKKNAVGQARDVAASARAKVEGSRDRHSMKGEPEIGSGQGMDVVLLAHRAQLIRFLELHGAGDAAEDIFQELWMRVTQRSTGPVGNPLGYLYRAANNLMVDRYRSERQSRARDLAWTDARGLEGVAPEPSAEAQLIAQEEFRRMNSALESLGDRVVRVFRRFRLDGVPQRQIAEELGVSLSTVEGDLRRAYAALLAVRRQSHDA